MCRQEGLLSPLYEYSHRGGCWFCPNASMTELRHLTATESLSLAMKMQVTAENNYNRNKNVIVFGPSGSGKSYSVAGPQLLQFNSNYVLSDPKGELLDIYGNVLSS